MNIKLATKKADLLSLFLHDTLEDNCLLGKSLLDCMTRKCAFLYHIKCWVEAKMVLGHRNLAEKAVTTPIFLLSVKTS